MKIIPIVPSKKADDVTRAVFYSFVEFKTQEGITHQQADQVPRKFRTIAADFIQKHEMKINWEKELLKQINPADPSLYVFGNDFREDLFVLWGTDNLWESVLRSIIWKIPFTIPKAGPAPDVTTIPPHYFIQPKST